MLQTITLSDREIHEMIVIFQVFAEQEDLRQEDEYYEELQKEQDRQDRSARQWKEYFQTEERQGRL